MQLVGSYSGKAGILLFFAGLQAIIMIIAAESLFPGYSIRVNDLGDLASTIPPNTSPLQPSATLFNMTIIILGLTVVFSTYSINRAFGRSMFTTLFATFGAAGIAVGIFPEDTGILHGISTLIWFVAGPLSAITSYKIVGKPFGYFSIAIGLIVLVDLVLSMTMHNSSPFSILGRGGTERMAAYPLLIWMIGLGGFLMGFSKHHGTKEHNQDPPAYDNSN
ncbi:MAG: DUF998 domain-containing protein [Thermoproteota archaeon]|nr:DUF998 domain-containing protein [Thermoproteota archaeon]